MQSPDFRLNERYGYDGGIQQSRALAPTPKTSAINTLPQPIAIPQVTPGMGIPFVRAYSPYFENHGISVSQFMAFIDGLNVAATASPPLQVLNLAGNIIGMVPHHWAVVTGNILAHGAQIGTAVVSKGRTELYMNKMNTELFNPRGLKVALATTEAMMTRCRIPLDTPLLGGDLEGSFQERLLAAVAPYTATTTLEVPPPTTQASQLDKLSAKQVDRDIKAVEKKRAKEREKEEAKRQRNRHDIDQRMAKLDEHVGSLTAHAYAKLEKGSKDAVKIEKKLERERSKAEKTRVKLEGKLGQPRAKEGKESKEDKQARKTLWILVENLDYWPDDFSSYERI